MFVNCVALATAVTRIYEAFTWLNKDRLNTSPHVPTDVRIRRNCARETLSCQRVPYLSSIVF